MKLFLCAGAAKAGTSWLYEMFKDNRELSFPQMKEINYLSSTYGGHTMPSRNLIGDREKRLKIVELGHGAFDTDEMKDHYLNGDLDDDWYINLFSRHRGPWCADFSPSTALLPIIGWKYILDRFCSDIRVMYIIRNPYDLLWSRIRFFFHIRQVTKFPKTAFEYETLINRHDLIISSLIGGHYSRMGAVIPPDKLKVYYHEDLRDQPLKFVRSVEKFVGLKPSEYDSQLLKDPRNVSPPTERPEFLNEMYKDVFENELDILEQHGVWFPKEWRMK